MTRHAEWRIAIDTGGTFTDGLAIDPQGRGHRVKILSSGALRGIVDRTLGPTRLRVSLHQEHAPPERAGEAGAGPAPGPASDLLRGFRFRLLAAEGPVPGTPVEDRRVERYDPAASTLDLTGPPLGAIAPDGTSRDELLRGSPFELISLEEAPVLAARLLTRTPPGAPLPAATLRLGTTLGTNALLERRCARTALFITRGFGDLLRIGTQQRPDLFALDVRAPEPLYEAVVEVPERLAADGSVLRPLDARGLVDEATRLVREGFQAAAIALLHSYRDPDHETRLRDLLLRCGFRHVSCSAEIAPVITLLTRAETAVVDAGLAPVVGGYLTRVRSSLAAGRLHLMTSAGGLHAATDVRPKDLLLSGPAGGVIGAALAGRRSGFDRLITFDMGGTSTDVARFDGDHEYLFEHRVGGARVAAPALAIETVAAGGGSVCWTDGGRLRVGPRSAGASPGPACYGAGGPVTLTDVNLLLGRLDPGRFEIPIVPERAGAAFESLRRGLAASQGEPSGEHPSRGQAPPAPEALLSGLLEIADELMAGAIRRVSLRRGYDPADYVLVAFGGAGGQHACGVAARLGVGTIVVPRDPGLLSAEGLAHAAVERFAERQVLRPLAEVEADLEQRFDGLAREARCAVEAEGIPSGEIEIRRRIACLRFVGQDAAVAVEHDPRVPLRQSFEKRYASLYGHRPEGRPVEVESLRVAASSRPPSAGDAAPHAAGEEVAPLTAATRRAHFGGGWREVSTFEREALRAGARFAGPALVFERHSATVVEPGWRAEVDRAGALVLRRADAAQGRGARADAGPSDSARPEAVRLELFTNRLAAIAEEMGERLGRTAVSTNVKERLDFSCALLDAEGELVVNAPHIPVHLGALGLCVRRLREALAMEPGDVVVTNHPVFGGSHLPDVTVVTPVFRGRALLGYVASRAHHAEIGGTRPGSMPPSARTLIEEGVVIPPSYLIRRGAPLWQEIRRRLESSPFPSRAVEDNLSDLRAAVAANHAGAGALLVLAQEHGHAAVRHYMRALTDLAERRVRDALARLPDGRYAAEERLDDGSPLRAAILIEGDRAVIDFTGSSGVHPGNLNATPAIVRSVVIYLLRVLLKEPLPLNEGLLRPVTLVLPEGILSPRFPDDPALAPAIVGGNVETSQRLVDTLLKALGLAACSQGTMNNVLFGNDAFGYYETIGGGCGAGSGFHGASAVHSHMTNTRITDPEVLEHRYPVRIDRFAVRRGSGGDGRFRGGDGIVREYTFLAPLSLSILSQHRTGRPYGLDGGEPGMAGAQRVIRTNGETEALRSIDSREVGPGDRLVVETPGGGGYGRPDHGEPSTRPRRT